MLPRAPLDVIGDNLLRLHPAPWMRELQASHVIDDMTFSDFLDIDDMRNLNCCQAGHNKSSAKQAGSGSRPFEVDLDSASMV
jgi:hypothetical protein